MKKVEFANEEIMSDFGKRAVLITATLFTYIFQVMSDVKVYRWRNMTDPWSSPLPEYHLPADDSRLPKWC